MIWQVLGIEKTNDIRKIKKAYSVLIKSVDPETDPDQFQKIHDAYRQACFYAQEHSETDKSKIILFEIYDFTGYNISFGNEGNYIRLDNGKSTKKTALTENDYDFSSLKLFKRQDDKRPDDSDPRETLFSFFEEIINDQAMVNSPFVWSRFFRNEDAVKLLKSDDSADRLDEILMRKRFYSKTADLLLKYLPSKTRIVYNKEFDICYLDVTGKRKIGFYIMNRKKRILKTICRVLSSVVLILAFFLIIIEKLGVVL